MFDTLRTSYDIGRAKPIRAVWPRFVLTILMILALATGAAAIAWPRRDSEQLITIANAMRSRRTVGRLWGAYAYRPYRAFTTDRDGSPAQLLVLIVKSREDSRETAVAKLFLGNASLTIEMLEELLGSKTIEQSNDVALLNDLFVAHYERATREKQTTDMMTAASAAHRVRKLVPNSQQAAWNYALALEGLGLHSEARAAWDHFLALDGTSEWAREARRRRLTLDQARRDLERKSADMRTWSAAVWAGDTATAARVAARYPADTLRQIERRGIWEWADAVRRNDGTAEPILSAIEASGTAIASAIGDWSAVDFARAVNRAADPRAIAELHAEWNRLRRSGKAASDASLQGVQRRLAQAGSPVHLSVRLHLANRSILLGRRDRPLEELQAIEREANGRRPLLLTEILQARGHILVARAEVAAARNAYSRALSLAEIADDQLYTGGYHSWLADAAELAGNTDALWDHHIRAMQRGEIASDPYSPLLHLDEFARAALRHDHLAVAEIVNNALFDRTNERDTDLRCRVLITRCDLLMRRGKLTAAHTECTTAWQLWAPIPDTAATTRNPYEASRALFLRARAYLLAGAPARARTDLESALAFMEQHRERLETLEDRIAYFETSEEIARTLVGLLVDQGETDAALEIVERVRARGLLDRVAGHPVRPEGTLDTTRKLLGPGRVLVEYWLDDDQLYAWVIQSDRTTFIRRSAGRRVVANAVKKLLSSIERGIPDVEAERFLYAKLIRPLLPSLCATDELMIVPDSVLANVPFAALRDSKSGEYLVERYAITRLPSAAAFAVAPAMEHRPRSVLVLAEAPSPGRSSFHAGEEIAAAASIGRADVLRGAKATPSVLLSRAHRYDAIHLAVHADEGPATEPVLALAPEPGRPSGHLFATDIDTLNLRPGALVVAAACRTSRGRQRTEGTMSLARAFAAAGASSVIAALWDVANDDSNALFMEFYPALARGETPAQALRSAQRAMLANVATKAPRQWAMYQVIGGR